MNFQIKNGALTFAPLAVAYFANLICCVCFYSDFFLPSLIAPIIWVLLPLGIGLNDGFLNKTAFKVAINYSTIRVENKIFFHFSFSRNFYFSIYK